MAEEENRTGYMDLVDPEILRIAIAIEKIAGSMDLNAIEDAKAYATGMRNNVSVQTNPDDPAYNNNAKYYAEQARSYATGIGNALSNANADALRAEGYAKGTQNGNTVQSGEYYQKNAKYYQEQSAEDRRAAALYAATALAAANTASAAYNISLIADIFDASQSYSQDEIRLYNGGLYVAKRTTTPGPWNSADWEPATVTDAVKRIAGSYVSYGTQQALTAAQKEQALENMGAVGKAIVAPDYNPSSPYAVGAPVFHNGTLWRCKTEIGTNGEAWNSEHWEAIQLGDLGQSFDSGYCQENQQNGKTYLHLTQDGRDIDGFTPFEVSGGQSFDGGYVAKGEDDIYYLHLTKNDKDLPQSSFTPIAIPAGGGGGSAGSAISITGLVRPDTVRDGGAAVYSFNAISSDSTAISVQWYVNDTYIKTTADTEMNKNHSFDAGPYLNGDSTNTVSIRVASEGGGTLTRRWSVLSVPFRVSWGGSINPVMLYESSADVNVVVKVEAEYSMIDNVTVIVNDDPTKSVTKQIIGASEQEAFKLNAAWFTSGKNTVKAYMVSAENASDRSNEIQFAAIWAVGVSAPIVAFSESAINCTQYDTVRISYFVYDPANETAEATFQIGDQEPMGLSVVRALQTYDYTPMTDGTVVITLACGDVEDSISIVATESPNNLSKIENGLEYDLDPMGHSNNESGRESFGNLDFSSGFDWENGGFKQDENGAQAFVVKKGSRVTLPRALFADSDASGKTIDISYRIKNSDVYDAVAMQELDGANVKGIIVRSNEVEIRMNANPGEICRCCEDMRVDLSILVEQSSASQRIVTIWMDGIPSRVLGYAVESMVQNSGRLTIGSDHCDVWVYGIRIYNIALDEKSMLQNFVYNGNNVFEKNTRFTQNDVFSNRKTTNAFYEHYEIDPEKLHAAIPELTIITIEAARMSRTKSDAVPANITIRDGSNILQLSNTAGTVFKVQGTSSVAYERSSLNLDIDFKKTGQTYAISEKSIPVNYLNIKVNVASSENANNICAVDWYNEYQPFIFEARENDSRVRDTVEGKPCAVFFTNTSNAAIWIGSQLVPAKGTTLYAMGDICNSKKNAAVFGQDGKGTHPTKACIEVSDNQYAPQRFQSGDAVYNSEDGEWQITTTDIYGNTKQEKMFEWRTEPADEELEEVVARWNETVSWAASTANNPTKFREECSRYFTMDSLIYHFLMIEYFAAYDNSSKNTFFSLDWDESADQSIWGGYRWNIKEAYDWDTILAFDNDGKILGDYGIDFGETYGNNRTYFNASSNVLWVNIKAAFQSELSAMYIRLRNQGAFDSAAIMAKWDNYQAKRPHAVMIRDAYVKYIYPYKTTGVRYFSDTTDKTYDSDYLGRLQGSKKYQRHQFLTYQTSYMDGKYGWYTTASSVRIRSNRAEGTETFTIKAYAKTYITIATGQSVAGRRKVSAGGTITVEGVTVGNNTYQYFTPEGLIQFVRPLNTLQLSLLSASGATKLMEAIVGSGTVNDNWNNDAGSLAVPSPILQTLSMQNVTNFTQSMDLSANTELKSLNTVGTQAGRITLAPYAPLTSLKLNEVSGLVMKHLTKISSASDFSLQSGNKLAYIVMEECNSYIVSAMMNTYIPQALARASTPEQLEAIKIRLTGVYDVNGSVLSLPNNSLLEKLLLAGSVDANGNEGSKPAVLTGRIHLPSARSTDLEKYNRVWPNVVTASNVINTLVVEFVNWDGTPIKDKDGNDYVQIVEEGHDVEDPINVLHVVLQSDVQRPGDYESVYTFAGWNELPTAINRNYTGKNAIKATYNASPVRYEVRFYDGIGAEHGTLLETVKDYVTQAGETRNYLYGMSVSPRNPCPTYGSPTSYVHYVFNGWDKYTGHITPDLNNKGEPIYEIIDGEMVYVVNVHARWIVDHLPEEPEEPQEGVIEMNWAQISSIVKRKLADVYWAPGAELHFNYGHGDDYDFDNVRSELLVGDLPGAYSRPLFFDGGDNPETPPLVFNGKNGLPLIQLFNGSIKKFTLAIDFEMISNVGELFSCFSYPSSGFSINRYLYGSYQRRFNILFGSSSKQLNGPAVDAARRQIMVIRYNSESNPNELIVSFVKNASGSYALLDLSNEEISVHDYFAHETIATSFSESSDCVLTFGGRGRLEGGDYADYRGRGWIYWAKLWYEYLDTDTVESIVGIPHLPAVYVYTSVKYYDGLEAESALAGADFQSTSCLPYDIHNYKTSNFPKDEDDYPIFPGWKDSQPNKFLNDVFYKWLPTPLMSLIIPVRIRVQRSVGTSKTPVVDYEDIMNKIYLPSYSEVCNTSSTIDPNEMDNLQHKRWGFTVERLARRWSDIPLTYDMIVIKTTDNSVDPTTIEEGPSKPVILSGKTIWHTDYFSYIYFDKDALDKHEMFGRMLYRGTEEDGMDYGSSSPNYLILAKGTDYNGKSGGVWIKSNYDYFFRTRTPSGSWRFYSYYYYTTISGSTDAGLLPAFSL